MTFVVVALLVSGCGGGGSNEDAGTFDQAFTGTWTGSGGWATSSYKPTPSSTSKSYAAYLHSTFVISGDHTVPASSVCPEFSSVPATVLRLQGRGNTATWDGTLECPPAWFPWCSYTLRHVLLTLHADGSLSVEGTGTAAGCDADDPTVPPLDFNFSYTGTK
jgi:hypothetical protein